MRRAGQQRFVLRWAKSCAVQSRPQRRNRVHLNSGDRVHGALQCIGLVLIGGAERYQCAGTVRSMRPRGCPRLRPVRVVQQWSNVPHVLREVVSWKIECRACRKQKPRSTVEQFQHMVNGGRSWLTRASFNIGSHSFITAMNRLLRPRLPHALRACAATASRCLSAARPAVAGS